MTALLLKETIKLLFLIELWLSIGFYISFYALIRSRNKKIKPSTLDLLKTVFLWPVHLVQVIFWRARMTDSEKEYVQKLLNERETKTDKS